MNKVLSNIEVEGEIANRLAEEEAERPSPARHLKAMVGSMEGCMWLGYKKGLIEKYSAAGKLLWSKVEPCLH